MSVGTKNPRVFLVISTKVAPILPLMMSPAKIIRNLITSMKKIECSWALEVKWYLDNEIIMDEAIAV